MRTLHLFFKNTILFLAIFFATNASGQIISANASNVVSTAYTNGSPNDPIYIFCVPNQTSANIGSLTAMSPVGGGPFTFNWYDYNTTTFSLEPFTTTVGVTSTINNLPSGGYFVSITNGVGTVVGCYMAWVFNNESNIDVANIAPGCGPFSLAGTVNPISNFVYYNPPPEPLIISASTTISVTFNATHTYISDLGFYLVSPCGQTITLSPNPGSNGQNNVCNSADNVVGLTFTSAPAPNFNPCNPIATYTGTYDSYGPAATPTLINWTPLYGCNAAQGGWSVQIYDCINLDAGALTNAVISFTGVGQCGPQTIVYNSGAINSPINDNSCTPGTASIFTVPPPVILTTPIVLPNTILNFEWTSDNPCVNIPNATTSLNPLITPVPDRDTWFYLTADDNRGCLDIIDSALFVRTCPCPVTNVSTNILPCNSAPGRYDIVGSVSFTNPPCTGQLIVQNCSGDIQIFNAPFVSPIAYNFTNIPADGTPGCTVTANFTDDNPLCGPFPSAPFTEPITPEPDDIPDTIACDNFTLPIITGLYLTGLESYYTGPSGTGTTMPPGTVLTSSQTVYIFAPTGPALPYCFGEESFILTIDDTDPVMTCPPPLTTDCSITDEPPYADFFAFLADGGTASDDIALDELSFILLSEVSDGLTCPETVTRTYQIADSCGHTITCQQTVTIHDITAPVLAAAPADVTVQCVADVPAMISLGYTDNCIAPGSVLGVDGLLMGGTCGGTITRTWTVTDLCGNTTTDTQIITVDDNIAPVLAAPPANITVSCIGDVPAMINLGYTDNCYAPGTVPGIEGPLVGGTCGGTITRTWTASDVCGNVSSVSQVITIDDNIAPVLAAPPANITVSCIGNVPAMISLGYTDNCDAPGSVIGTDGPLVGGTCGGTITRTWSRTDLCGNNSTVTQVITIDDNIAPVLAAPPVAITVSCIGNVPAMISLGYTDNCDAPGSVIGTDGPLVGGTCGGTITRTWSRTDLCGNSTSVTQIITVDDNIAPVLAAPPVAVTVSCIANVPAMTSIGYTDNCDAPGSVLGVDGPLVGGACGGTITRSWTATDICGNSTSVTQTITVDDNIAPVLAPPPVAITVSCIGNVPAMISLGYTDNCDAPGSVLGVDGPLLGGACGGTITRTWTATDICGNSTSVTQTITVDDNTPPVLAAAPADVTVECIGDIPAMISLGYTDNCIAPGSVLGVDGPLLGGTCGGTITRTWTITDACGNTTTDTQIITIDDTTPPVLAIAPVAVTVECIGDVPAMVSLGYTDNCDAPGSVLGVDGPLVGGICGGTITRTWTITDICGNVSSVSQVITIDDTTPPTGSDPATTIVPGGPAPAVNPAVVINEADNCTLSPTVALFSQSTDGAPCPETITRIYSITDDCGNVSFVTHLILITDPFLPTASNPLPINVECIADVPLPNVNVVTDEADNQGTPTVTFAGDVSNGNACPEIITRSYDVTDVCGGAITVFQTITILDVTAPVLAAAPVDITVECVGNVPAMISLGYTDNCDAPGSVLGVDGPLLGGACGGTITRTWTITDACGNTTTDTQIITIDDTTPPVLASAPADITVECIGDVPGSSDLNFTDNCIGAGAVASVDGPLVGGTCGGTITRTWTITDLCGNTSTETQIITVDDTTPPVLASAPVDVTVECVGDVPAIISLGYTDNCDAPGSVVGVDGPLTGGTCGGTITRTWTITDICGNTTTETQIITVDDNTAPVLAAAPADVTVECIGDLPPMISLGYTDNCNAPGSVSGVDGPLVGGACGGTITRTWTITDLCGNTTTDTQIITVDDTTLPTASNPATTIVPGGPAPAVNPLVVIDEADNCTVNPVVALFSQTTDGGTCPETITRIYSVTDNCGNVAYVTHIILITDPFIPTADPIPSASYNCIANVPAPNITIVTNEADNNGLPTVTYIGQVSDNGSCPETLTRTYRVTDPCGNFIDLQQIITINVTAGPVVPANTTSVVECLANVVQPAAPAVTDQCGNNLVPVITSNSNPVCEGNKVFTYTYTDCAGNISVYTHTVTIDLTNLPVVPADASSTVQCITDVVIPTAPAVVDFCGNTVIPVMTENADPVCTGDKIYTFTYTDCAGNVSMYTYTYTIDDNINPSASNPSAISVLTLANVPAPDPTVVIDEADNCSLSPTVAWVSDVSNGNVCNGEIITRTYSVTDDCGNSILVTQQINLTEVTPIITVGPDQTICAGESTSISATASPSGATLAWDNGVINNQPFSPGVTLTYTVTATQGTCVSTDNLTVTVDPLPLAPTAGTDTTYCEGHDFVPMTVSGTGGTYSWYYDFNLTDFGGDGSTFLPNNSSIGTTTYYVTEMVNGCEGAPSSVTITITECGITVPSAFTPDGDQVNDTWEIKNLDNAYPDNSVRVYNRWGNILYEHNSENGTNPYEDNQWHGDFKGNGLPVGSYYYIIDFSSDGSLGSETGTVSIIHD